MNVLKSSYVGVTPRGNMNFIGAVRRYFDDINGKNLEKTNDTYIDYYNNNIFPFINYGKALDDYDIEYVEDLLNLIQDKNEYKESTMRGNIRHLLYDPCKYYFREFHPDNNIFEINPSDFTDRDKGESIQSAELRIIKSLTVGEEKRAFRILMENPKTCCGEWVGLAIMFFTASRNNEACGFNYGDLLEMIDYPGCYYLQIVKSTEIKSNKLKAGGKTYNAFRRLPLVNVFSEYLLERMKFIEEQIEFPYVVNGIEYTSIYDLPIACRGDNYGVRCSADDLSVAGRTFLRENVGMTKSRIASIQLCILEDRNSEYDLGEKDPTTYLLRRNMATHLYTLGFTTLESQYFMGHKMEGSALKRSDFGDEVFLYKLWKKLQKHPLNNRMDSKVVNLNKSVHIENESNISLKAQNPGILKVRSREYDDSIRLNIKGDYKQMDVLDDSYHGDCLEEINITKLQRKVYKNK